MTSDLNVGDLVRIPVEIIEGHRSSDVGIVLSWEIYDVAESFPIKLLEIYAASYGTVKIDACYVSRI